MEKIKNLIELLDKSIKQDADLLLTNGNIIKDWYDEKVDEYREILRNSWNWLVDYQQKLISETKINNLKIKYTNNSWYFIEVSKNNLSKVPDYFILKQTLVNSSRFVTLELKEYEQKFLEAQNNLASREYELFQEIRAEILDNFNEIKNLSKKTALLDFQVSLSKVAYENNYNRPEVSDNYDLEIKSWRHPVIEEIEKDFISNDLKLNKKEYIHLITWPNMGWKSTFLRQNALIILLAHIWSFVPARSAKIPITDRIFSRVWASDNLYLWQSTFMVEMQEVANILNNATKNSFVIIDEVWRWTSTYDWMSIAWAILKNLSEKIKCKTLFATHYHELIKESKILTWVWNYSVSVWENDENIVFLRKVVPWWINKSYWIEVAKLAWLSKEILEEARQMLKILEAKNNNTFKQLSLVDSFEPKVVEKKVVLESEVEKELKNIDLNNLTPIQALNLLNELKWKIKK